MRILFVLSGSVWRFEGVLDGLASRGHEVHLAVRNDPRGLDELAVRLQQRYPAFTYGIGPSRGDRWAALAEVLGLGLDYLRYLSPEYAHAPKLRARSEEWAPRSVVRLAAWPLVRTPTGLRLLRSVMRALQRAIPDSREITDFIRAQRPDLVLVSPLVKPKASQAGQADYVRGARSLGTRSALVVRSWDTLTNKGLIHASPDRLYVWNDDQRREATELHGVPGERVIATGAYPWDQWFRRKPSTTPEEFRRRLGFRDDAPIVLYVCSSKFVAPNEPPFVQRWLRALRQHDDHRLRNACVLIRPYPGLSDRWRDSPEVRSSDVAVWPLDGPLQGKPSDEESKSNYFDSLFHCSGVVGLNTSALIEAAIVGRPVFTLLDPEYRDTQEGTLHFHYLPRRNGGPVTVGRDFSQHFAQLADILSGNGRTNGVDREFLRRFVRPHGIDRPAVPILVEALERQGPAPLPRPLATRAGRTAAAVVLGPVASLTDRRVRSKARPTATPDHRRSLP